MSEVITGHILLVDDQENWREALASLLFKEGYAVETAACFEDAKEQVLSGTFDLMVVDVRLADRDIYDVRGLELLRLAKEQEAVPKVIVLTGYPDSIRDGTLEQYDADALVLKVPPDSRKFDTQGFRDQIRRLLQKT